MFPRQRPPVPVSCDWRMLIWVRIGAAMLMNDHSLHRLRRIRNPARKLGMLKTIALTRRDNEVKQQSILCMRMCK